MDIGQHVELVVDKLGSKVGTKGIIKSTETGSAEDYLMQLYPLVNNVVLPVMESEIKKVEETQTHGTTELEKKKAKPRRKTV